jgi:hypothetical protein
MHASVMRRTGARPEVARDNMGHSETSMTLNGYSRSWWDERISAVANAVAVVVAAPAARPERTETQENAGKQSSEWAPSFFGAPVEISELSPAKLLYLNGRGERI